MGWNGNGQVTRNQNYTADKNAGAPQNKISAAKVDEDFTNTNEAIENCLSLDGQNAPTQDIPWGGRKIKNLGAPTDANDGANKSYVDGKTTVSGFATETPANDDNVAFSDTSDGGALKKAAISSILSLLATAGFGQPEDMASAATVNIGAAAGKFVNITGTTTITSFGGLGSTKYPFYLVRFTGALTLTHNVSTLSIPNGQNVTTAADDYALMQYLGSGAWRVVQYIRSNGNALSALIATTSLYGVLRVGTPAVVAAGTSLVDAITPGNLQNHPNAVKAWGFFTTSGGAVTNAGGVNLTAQRISAGVYEFTMAAPMPNANYAVNGTGSNLAPNGGSNGLFVLEDLSFTRTTTKFRLHTLASSFNNVDAVRLSVSVMAN